VKLFTNGRQTMKAVLFVRKAVSYLFPSLAVLSLIGQVRGASVLIDFEAFPDGTTPLNEMEVTTQFASLGVTFGSIHLPEASQISTLIGYVPTVSGFNALGPNGVAPNIGGTLILTFATPVTQVGSYFIDDQLPVHVTAFDTMMNIAGTATSDVTSVGFDQWQISSASGISRVEMAGGYFAGNSPDGWLVDDLSFTAVPEPTPIGLLFVAVIGLVCFGFPKNGKIIMLWPTTKELK
jgi:hypothetical protein